MNFLWNIVIYWQINKLFKNLLYIYSLGLLITLSKLTVILSFQGGTLIVYRYRASYFVSSTKQGFPKLYFLWQEHKKTIK